MNTRKGFTLIELMIVIAIIAIIAAIALPNLMRSRVQANEANAIAALKAYATAQVNFQTAQLGRLAKNTNAGDNGYADNFRNLAFASPVLQGTGDDKFDADDARNTLLISEVFANAFAISPRAGCAAIAKDDTGALAAARPYQGYLFGEPKEVAAPVAAQGQLQQPATYFTTNFSLLAVPQIGTSTGTNMFWIGQQDTVWVAPLAASTDGFGVSIATATPTAAEIAGGTPSGIPSFWLQR